MVSNQQEKGFVAGLLQIQLVMRRKHLIILVKIGQNKSQKRNYNEAIEVLYNYKFKMN
jgi:predicted metal-dependent hydrolase